MSSPHQDLERFTEFVFRERKPLPPPEWEVDWSLMEQHGIRCRPEGEMYLFSRDELDRAVACGAVRRIKPPGGSTPT